MVLEEEYEVLSSLTGAAGIERVRSDDPDVVLARYLDELAGGVDTATDDQLVLAGALLGSAVGVLCPRHTDSVG